MLKNRVVTCELLISSNSAGYSANTPAYPMFPALPLHIQMLPFTLICSFILSCLPLEQCSLNPLFLSVFLEKYYILSGMREIHLSIIETDWNHSSSRAYNFSTPSHFLCFNWKNFLFPYLSPLLTKGDLSCYTSVQWGHSRRQLCCQ